MDNIEGAIWADVHQHESGCWTWSGQSGCNIIRLLAELSGNPLPANRKMYRMPECKLDSAECVNPEHVGTYQDWLCRVQTKAVGSPDRNTVGAEAPTGRGDEKAANALADLPLERRYLYRIASSLRQAFIVFDTSSVRADLSTMNAADFDYVVGLIERRPVQFAMLLRTIFGAEQMEKMLSEAIDIAKRI